MHAKGGIANGLLTNNHQASAVLASFHHPPPSSQGVLGGVTGIITQPMVGAQKEGVEGFFKGLGKGLIGTVTRPISGVVDFANSSFEGIRR